MANLVFSRVGAQIGKAVLPNGIRFLGAGISGSSLGRALGTYAANAQFAPTIDGPRIESLALMESREGAGIPNVYGRMRVAGQVIWAARFKENSRERRPGGKTGPKVRDYSYSVSFAVALCEGEASRIGEVWANGEPMDLAGVTWRFYPGSETQDADPLIEAIEGPGQAPAYRGVSYVVFEDLPLADFGNRLPQLSFEVFRAAPGETETASLRDLIKGVNIIPASGEFAYDTEIISTRRFPGIVTPQNVNASRSEADFTVSMVQLESDLPNVQCAALTVGWFGNSLSAGSCLIRPGVETRDKTTVPEEWSAGGADRESAYLISQSQSGHANYGGTPSDASVIRALRDLSERGIAPTVTPFLFMDIPDEETPFPWRGRISGSASDVAAFLGGAQLSDFQIEDERVIYTGDPDDWGYRRFVLHLAHLVKIAGGVEAFLIGSEMVSLSRLRAADGSFPFVDGLAALASDVKTLLGAAVKISYAADWTEYGAFVDGNDVSFPLDPLWASPDVDFVGVDWYPPMADWRDGEDHFDAQAGYEGPEDPAYLLANAAGGEAFDWYYASDADRDAQVRTPIVDTAHGEHWVFRQKDLLGWWSNAHHARLDGVRSSAPTLWQAGSKPIRLMEIGFPAVDKGANAPNLFYDLKSSESALPPFSDGTRDDLQQRRALETALSFWQGEAAIEAAYVWCWDARPFPTFPARSDVWSDGANWQYGHWLNGRVGASELGDIVRDICTRAGVSVDVSQLSGVVEGYALSGVSSLRGVLEPLRAAHGFQLIEQGGDLVFRQDFAPALISITSDNILDGSPQIRRALLDKRPGAVRLTYISASNAYAPETTEARDPLGDRDNIVDVSLPMVMGTAQAEGLALSLLLRARSGDSAELGVSLAHLGLQPGDVIALLGGEETWRVRDTEDDGIARAVALETYVPASAMPRNVTVSESTSLANVFGAPELLVIDAMGDALRVAATGEPWPGEVRVLAGVENSALTERARIDAPANMGRVVQGVTARPIGRWDHASELIVEMPIGELSAATPAEVLAGANQMFVETSTGWERLAFTEAELIAPDQYRVRQLLRALGGTTPGEIISGARCVIIDEALQVAAISPEEIGLDLVWQIEAAGQFSAPETIAYENRSALAYRPGHLRVEALGNETYFTWTRRGADVPLSWTLPEAENAGNFQVEFWDGEAALSVVSTEVAELTITLPDGTTEVRVAEISADGRPGTYAVLPIPASLA